MKRTIISALCIAVAFIFANSCNRIEDNPIASVGNGRTIITAVAEAVGKGDTKAHNQYSYDVLWDNGDIISTYDPYHLSTDNLVFLPAESSRDSLKVLDYVGETGHYHSGTPITGYSVKSLYFYNGHADGAFHENRNLGSSVRLVRSAAPLYRFLLSQRWCCTLSRYGQCRDNLCQTRRSVAARLCTRRMVQGFQLYASLGF